MRVGSPSSNHMGICLHTSVELEVGLCVKSSVVSNQKFSKTSGFETYFHHKYGLVNYKTPAVLFSAHKLVNKLSF